jgi:hypothetical protein
MTGNARPQTWTEFKQHYHTVMELEEGLKQWADQLKKEEELSNQLREAKARQNEAH